MNVVLPNFLSNLLLAVLIKNVYFLNLCDYCSRHRLEDSGKGLRIGHIGVVWLLATEQQQQCLLRPLHTEQGGQW